MTYYITNEDLSQRLKDKCDITVTTLTDRDSIALWRRKWSMVVGVFNDPSAVNNGLYLLKYGKVSTNLVDNQNWDFIENHARKHNIISTEDHLIEAVKGQIILTTSESTIDYFTVKAETIQGVGDQIVLQYDFPEKEIIIGLDETKVNHNNLLNYEADRHRKMNYDEDIRAYKIED